MMQRRHFLTCAAGVAGAMAAAPFTLAARAGIPSATDRFRPGKHFYVIDKPTIPKDPQVVEVVEVFSYMCIHCFNFDAPVEAWRRKLPDGAVFRRSPAIFSDSWRVMAQAYYTAQALGVLDTLHGKFFRALHVDRKNIAGQSALRTFFQDNAGVSPADFDRTWDSFNVVSAVQQADSRAKIWGITAVPQMVVNGKYRLDERLLSNSPAGMLEVADWLVAWELAAV